LLRRGGQTTKPASETTLVFYYEVIAEEVEFVAGRGDLAPNGTPVPGTSTRSGYSANAKESLTFNGLPPREEFQSREAAMN